MSTMNALAISLLSAVLAATSIGCADTADEDARGSEGAQEAATAALKCEEKAVAAAKALEILGKAKSPSLSVEQTPMRGGPGTFEVLPKGKNYTYIIDMEAKETCFVAKLMTFQTGSAEAKPGARAEVEAPKTTTAKLPCEQTALDAAKQIDQLGFPASKTAKPAISSKKGSTDIEQYVIKVGKNSYDVDVIPPPKGQQGACSVSSIDKK